MHKVKDQIFEQDSNQQEPLTEVITIEGEEPWPEEWSTRQKHDCSKSKKEIEEQIKLDEEFAKKLQQKFYEEQLESAENRSNETQIPVHIENPTRQIHWDEIDDDLSYEDQHINSDYDEEYDEHPQRTVVVPYRRNLFDSDFMRRMGLFDNYEQCEDDEENLEWNHMMSIMDRVFTRPGRIFNQFFD
jgi:hypothetical protein